MLAATIIGLHLATAHAGNSALETATPGAYVQLAGGATFGAFRNSYGRGSAYAGYTWRTEDGRFALTAGAVTGYPARRVLPLLTPSVQLPLAGGYAARLAWLPRQPQVGTAHGLHFALERAL